MYPYYIFAKSDIARHSNASVELILFLLKLRHLKYTLENILLLFIQHLYRYKVSNVYFHLTHVTRVKISCICSEISSIKLEESAGFIQFISIWRTVSDWLKSATFRDLREISIVKSLVRKGNKSNWFFFSFFFCMSLYLKFLHKKF